MRRCERGAGERTGAEQHSARTRAAHPWRHDESEQRGGGGAAACNGVQPSDGGLAARALGGDGDLWAGRCEKVREGVRRCEKV